MDISVVIISWNVRELLLQCLASVRQQTQRWAGRTEIIVVDNASSDGSAVAVSEGFPDVRLIRNAENRGFAAGCNQGIASASGDAVLLLNPDAELQPNALTHLSEYLQQHHDVAAVGPMLLNADGTVQPSRRRFPTILTGLIESTFIQTHLPRLREFRRYYYEDQPDNVTQDVDWLVGAALLVRRAALEQAGGLDEQFFLYFEETDWCRRAKQLGWRIVYLPPARVVHLAGRSSEQVMTQRHRYFIESKYRYFRKHFGRGAAALVRGAIVASYTLQILEDALKLAVGHKAAMRRERISMLGSALKTALTL